MRKGVRNIHREELRVHTYIHFSVLSQAKIQKNKDSNKKIKNTIARRTEEKHLPCSVYL